MGDHEAEIGGKVIGENSKVTLKVKTLVWAISGMLFVVSTLATIGYYDIKSEQESLKKEYDQGKEDYKEEVKNLLQEELKDLRENDEDFIKDVGEIKGDIKVILDRTMRSNNSNSNNIVPIEENVLPRLVPGANIH